MDKVIEILYKNSGNAPTFEKIETWLKPFDIEKGEIQDCLLYLYKEGYIYCETEGNRFAEYKDTPKANYLLNFKGKRLYEDENNYSGMVRNQKFDRRSQKWVMFLTFFLSAVVGVYAVLDYYSSPNYKSEFEKLQKLAEEIHLEQTKLQKTELESSQKYKTTTEATK